MAFASPKAMFGPASWDEDEPDLMEESWIHWALNPRHKPYSHEFTSNLKAGVTVALVNVPLSISLSLAAGGTPSQGIITAFWCGLVSAIFSSSHFNVVGPTGALSGMLAVITMRHGAAILPIVALIASAWLFIFYILRIDRYMRYVCSAVAHGFSVGVAVIIATSQLPSAFGLTTLPAMDNIVGKIEVVILNLTHARVNDTLFFFANVIPLFYCAKRWGKVPWAIFYAAFGMVVGYYAKPGTLVLLNNKYPNLKMSLVTPIDFTMKPEYHAPDVMLYSFGVAVVGLLESLIAAQIANQITPNNENLNYNSRRESFGLALSNLVGGIFGGIPSTAALARTSLNVKSGAWSRLSGVVGCATVALLASVLLPWFEYIPMPTVAAMLMLVSYRLVDFGELAELRISDTPGTYAFIVTAAACIMTDTFFGLLVGAAISLFFNIIHLGVVRMEVHPADEKGSFVAVMHSSMVFVNTNEVKDAFIEILKMHKAGNQISIVLDECSHVDFDGAKAFHDVLKTFKKKGWSVRITGVKHIQAVLENACPAYVELMSKEGIQEM